MSRRSLENPRIRQIRRPSRVRRGAALTALCALALAACGTERTGHRDPKTGSGNRVEADAAAAPRTGSDDAEFLAFMELLNALAEPCRKDVPTQEPHEESDTAEPRTEPLSELSVPDEPPTAEPEDPEAAKKEVELSVAEKCDARIHVHRIRKALKDTPDATPRQVREILRGIGYIDERIHGPQRSGETVQFTLDLRVMGGQLCLSGSVSGTRTVIEPYGASVEVGCPEVQRRR